MAFQGSLKMLWTSWELEKIIDILEKVVEVLEESMNKSIVAWCKHQYCCYGYQQFNIEQMFTWTVADLSLTANQWPEKDDHVFIINITVLTL